MAARFFFVETQRCESIFAEENSDEWAILQLDDEAHGSHEDEGHWQVEVNPSNIWEELLNGGSGEGQSSTSTTLTTLSTASGIGGSDPPEDSRGSPLIPIDRDHQSEAEGEAKPRDIEDGFEDVPLETPEESENESEDSKEDVPLGTPEESENETEDSKENTRAGVTCSYCKRQPQTVRVFFTGEPRANCVMGVCVFCSKECAENGTTEKQVIMSVNLWDTETSALRPCAICFLLQSMPLTVCRNCKAYVCGSCSKRCKNWKGIYKCPHQCPDSSGMDIIMMPGCIAEPARLKTVELESLVPADQSGEEREVAGVIQRMSQEQQKTTRRK